MKTYRSPIYPALMVNLGDGTKVKAAGGYFEVEDEHVERFEAIMAERPHYLITALDDSEIARPEQNAGVTGTLTSDGLQPAPGTVVQPEPMSQSERHPEQVTVANLEELNVPTLRERLQGLGLDDRGRKSVLVQRLAEALNIENPGTAVAAAATEEATTPDSELTDADATGTDETHDPDPE